MHKSDSISGEQLSALMDGEALGAQRAQAVSALLADPAAQVQWHLYHLAGDVVRSADLAPTTAELEFSARLQRRLALEPGLPARLAPATPAHGLAAVHATRHSANADKGMDAPGGRRATRWNAVSRGLAFGMCTFVAIVLWNRAATPDTALQSAVATPTPTPTVTLPAAPPPTASTFAQAPDAQVMLRDPELDALLSAHRAMGGNSALQLPSGFLRNATFERPKP